MKAALYILHYIHSTHNYGFSFTFEECTSTYTLLLNPMLRHTVMQSLHPSLLQAPSLSTCWGSQLGSLVTVGTLFLPIKFCSRILALSLKMVLQLVGLVGIRNAHLSAHVKQKLAPQMPPWRRLLTFPISLGASLLLAALFLILMCFKSSATTMMHASNGPTATWPQRPHVTSSFVKIWFRNGFRIRHFKSSTSLARLIRLKSSPKRCAMVHILVAFKIPSCRVSLHFCTNPSSQFITMQCTSLSWSFPLLLSYAR